MQQNNQFLTEENYQKSKKKLKRLSLIILIAGLLLGGGLITAGIILTNNAKQQNAETADRIQQESDAKQDSQQARITEVQADLDSAQAEADRLDTEIINLRSQISQLRNEQQQIFREDHGFSERYNAKEAEITQVESQISTNNVELSKLHERIFGYQAELAKLKISTNDSFNDIKNEVDVAKDTISTSKYIFLYFIGGFIIIASCTISLCLYLFSKGREISAFTVQQKIPIAQEGINTMAPTVGNAAGTIAENVARGIKTGLDGANTSNHPTTPPQPKH